MGADAVFPDAACVVGVFCCHAGKGAAALGAVDVSAFAKVQLLLQMLLYMQMLRVL